MSAASIVDLFCVNHGRVDQRKKDGRHFRTPPTMATSNFPLNRRTRHLNGLDAAKDASVKNWRLEQHCWEGRVERHEPIEVASHQNAMKLRLDQLYWKEPYVLILHHTAVEDSQRRLGSVTVFSGLHRAWRLQEPATGGNVAIRYVVFGEYVLMRRRPAIE